MTARVVRGGLSGVILLAAAILLLLPVPDGVAPGPMRAAGLVVFHTHPSGDPSPSPEDHHFTRRMEQAGEVVGVRLVDHLILGCTGRWVSLRQMVAW